MTPEEKAAHAARYFAMTPEEKTARRRANGEEYARSNMESRGITIEEHTHRTSRDAAEREAISKDNGDEEDEEE